MQFKFYPTTWIVFEMSWSVKILFIQANPLNMFFYLTGEGERGICTNLIGSQLWSTLFSTFFCQNEQNLSKADTSKKVSARFREVPLYMKIYYLLFVLKSMMKWKFRRWFYIFSTILLLQFSITAKLKCSFGFNRKSKILRNAIFGK